MASEHYDVIIIGSGAGGGTLAHRLAPSGKRVLLLERGGYLPREPENWDSREVFGKDRYLSGEQWIDDQTGEPFHPHQQYFVGGNTKFYGAILFRLRERDFGEVAHYGGVSPAWPLSYSDFEPYYAEAERLYLVHGQDGEDPTEPPLGHALIGPFGVFVSLGGMGLIVAAIAAGVALYRHAGAPVSVPVLLAISGLLITVHPPPYGPTGLALFIVAVLLYVRSQSRHRATAPLGQPRSA